MKAEKLLSLVTVGFGHSPKAYADEDGVPVTHAPAPVLANHHFYGDDDGRLVHEIDGHVRARIPPEGMREYCEAWPDAAAIAKNLLDLGEWTGLAAPARAKKSRGAPRPPGTPKAKRRR